MEENKLIRITAITNIDHLPNPVLAFIWVEVDKSHQCREVAARLAEIPEIGFVGMMLGRFDIMAITMVQSNEQLTEFLHRRISGIHGVFKHLDKQVVGGKLVKDEDAPKFFNQDKLDELRARQINTVKYLDEVVFPKLYDIVPKNTFITVTADHGELFGESGYFGHGPIMHEKVFEVPFLEAQVR